MDPGPDYFLLAEYTAFFEDSGHRKNEFRLFHLARDKPGKPPEVFGVAWKVKPDTPESPIYTPTFSSRWVSAVTNNLQVIGIEVVGLGTFFIQG
jgi:hypothetical protein